MVPGHWLGQLANLLAATPTTADLLLSNEYYVRNTLAYFYCPQRHITIFSVLLLISQPIITINDIMIVRPSNNTANREAAAMMVVVAAAASPDHQQQQQQLQSGHWLLRIERKITSIGSSKRDEHLSLFRQALSNDDHSYGDERNKMSAKDNNLLLLKLATLDNNNYEIQYPLRPINNHNYNLETLAPPPTFASTPNQLVSNHNPYQLFLPSSTMLFHSEQQQNGGGSDIESESLPPLLATTTTTTTATSHSTTAARNANLVKQLSLVRQHRPSASHSVDSDRENTFANNTREQASSLRPNHIVYKRSLEHELEQWGILESLGQEEIDYSSAQQYPLDNSNNHPLISAQHRRHLEQQSYLFNKRHHQQQQQQIDEHEDAYSAELSPQDQFSTIREQHVPILVNHKVAPRQKTHQNLILPARSLRKNKIDSSASAINYNDHDDSDNDEVIVVGIVETTEPKIVVRKKNISVSDSILNRSNSTKILPEKTPTVSHNNSAINATSLDHINSPNQSAIQVHHHHHHHHYHKLDSNRTVENKTENIDTKKPRELHTQDHAKEDNNSRVRINSNNTGAPNTRLFKNLPPSPLPPQVDSHLRETNRVSIKGVKTLPFSRSNDKKIAGLNSASISDKRTKISSPIVANDSSSSPGSDSKKTASNDNQFSSSSEDNQLRTTKVNPETHYEFCCQLNSTDWNLTATDDNLSLPNYSITYYINRYWLRWSFLPQSNNTHTYILNSKRKRRSKMDVISGNGSSARYRRHLASSEPNNAVVPLNEKISAVTNQHDPSQKQQLSSGAPRVGTCLNGILLSLSLISLSPIKLTNCQAVHRPMRGTMRLCVTQGDYPECLEMVKNRQATAIANPIGCVEARDRFECMKLIINGQADVVQLDNEELYLAGRLYNLEPFAMEQYRQGDTQAVAVINRQANINSVADLKGKRSCHGAMNSTFGWDVPVGLLLATLTMAPDCRGELYSVSKFFDQTCAPDPYVDSELKKLHPNLCGACRNSTLCSMQDEYASDEGAIKCLLRNAADVAFTTREAMERFLQVYVRDGTLLDQYQYLCLDGTKQPLTTRNPCEWARKPGNVFVTSPGRSLQKDTYYRLLEHTFVTYEPVKPSWWKMKSFISNPMEVARIVQIPFEFQQWDRYLGNYISSIEKPLPGCEPRNVTFCTASTMEETKCLELQKVAFSRRIRPEIDCKRRNTKQECIDMVSRGRADLLVIDMTELYETSRLTPDYAVALVKADSGIKFLYQLGGRRSCHPSFGDIAGWLIPIDVLSERSMLDRSDCNKADQMANYFGGSCVPGAADLRVNQYRSGSDRLCDICQGDEITGLHQCERSPSERFYGQNGALRCLVEGAGDVAFLSHSALMAHVNGRSTEVWTRNDPLALDSKNFRLICRVGPSMLITDAERCNLSKMPGKMLATSRFASWEDKLLMRKLAVWLADRFRQGSREFQLFAPYNNISNLIFDDTTTSIVAIPSELSSSSFDSVFRQYFDSPFEQVSVSKGTDTCKVTLTSGSESEYSSIGLGQPLVMVGSSMFSFLILSILSTCY